MNYTLSKTQYLYITKTYKHYQWKFIRISMSYYQELLPTIMLDLLETRDIDVCIYIRGQTHFYFTFLMYSLAT